MKAIGQKTGRACVRAGMLVGVGIRTVRIVLPTVLAFVSVAMSQTATTAAGTGKTDSGKTDSQTRGSTQAGAKSAAEAKAPALPAPKMIYIPGGEFWMGSTEAKFTDARPVHRVRLDGFWIDETLVTNREFARFVEATHYVTEAEKKPRPEDFPGADPAKLVAGSLVFTTPVQLVSDQNPYPWWDYREGANWKHPEGVASSLKGLGQHPVVQVAYADAAAYCSWLGETLPTEAQFEFAARGGLDRKRYAWGDEFTPGGKYMANTFQGHFPESNTSADGFPGTSPVKSFPANGYGLYDMAGNVWEWTTDWYRPDTYEVEARTAEVSVNPTGPADKADSFDPGEPGVAKRVERGGSYLCTEQYCSRYMVGGRGKGEPGTSTNHVGFRCVKPGPEAEGADVAGSKRGAGRGAGK